MKLKYLIYKDEYNADREIEDIEVLSVSTKVSEICDTSLFVLQKSVKFDVTKIIPYIISKKPRAIICEYDISFGITSIPIIRVESTRRLIPYIFSRFYGIDYKKLRFIGVTGTNGKTTTATVIYRILCGGGYKAGFIGTGKILIGKTDITEKNYSMTTPDAHLLYKTIKAMQEAKCEFIVMEVSSHALYFDKVLPIRFEVSLFTNLSPEHLDFHKDIEDYYSTKMKLFLQSGYGIFNLDDEYSKRSFLNAPCKKKCVGFSENADAKIEEILHTSLSGSEYVYKENEERFKLKTKLGGRFNIYNTMMAVSALRVLGVEFKTINRELQKIKGIDGRLEIIEDGVTVIIDYAHTPTAFENILKSVKENKKSGQKIISVFGCGGERDREKRPQMAMIAEEYSDFVIVTEDNSRGESEAEIIKDILRGFTNSEHRIVITSRKCAIEYALLNASDGDIVLLIGKGHERYNIGKGGYTEFDERAIVREALKKREVLQNKKCE